jgi:predicted PurR-regulated permease PerM
MSSLRGPERPAQTVAIVLISVIVVGAVLYAMRSVILPIILAIFFASLSRPLQVRLQKVVPTGLALVLTILLMGGIILALPLLFSANLQVVIARLPEYGPRFQGLAMEIEALLRDVGIDLKGLDMSSDRTAQSIMGVVTDALQGIASFTGTFVLVLFLLIFILAEANVIRDKLAVALKPTNHATVMASVASMQERIQKYVTTKTLFSALNAVAAGLLTWALGVDFPLLWTLLTFILYFIPTFGTLIATFPPVLLALVQFEAPTTAIVTLIGLIVIFNLLGNVLEPKFLGKTLSLSPLIVFISLMFWGWYFGIVGVILSVPLTVGIVIVCQHIEPLQPIAILFADKPQRPGESDLPSPQGERTR